MSSTLPRQPSCSFSILTFWLLHVFAFYCMQHWTNSALTLANTDQYSDKIDTGSTLVQQWANSCAAWHTSKYIAKNICCACAKVKCPQPNIIPLSEKSYFVTCISHLYSYADIVTIAATLHNIYTKLGRFLNRPNFSTVHFINTDFCKTDTPHPGPQYF